MGWAVRPEGAITGTDRASTRKTNPANRRRNGRQRINLERMKLSGLIASVYFNQPEDCFALLRQFKD